jgi:hypothetical protein
MIFQVKEILDDHFKRKKSLRIYSIERDPQGSFRSKRFLRIFSIERIPKELSGQRDL